MMPDLENFEQRSDRERRARERELLLLLLALFDETRSHVYAALRIGADPFAAAQSVLLGNPSIHQPGLAKYQLTLNGRTVTIPGILAGTEADGLHRAELVVGTDLQGGSTDDPTWLSLAQQYAVQMLGTLNRRIRDALATARNARGGAQDAIREAMRTWGYSEDGPSSAWLLETVSEGVVGAAYGAGQFRGWLNPESGVTGLRYVAVLDNRTSDICLAYDGVRLPIGHRWILSHFPLNHFRCRSMFRPLVGAFERTPENEIPWSPPPQAGFGIAPLLAYGVPLYRAA